ncbi:hypothetical protein P692DRAFT_20876302 [Suillus brevipes Sb2]|nr:hypothetical protein P692DRAFT_20876302 [Suillus brevipes Sb2]
MSQAESSSQPSERLASPFESDEPMATSTVTVSAAAASDNARQRWKIAALEQKLQVLEAGRMVKQRETNYFMSQGRAIRRMVTLFDCIEDLISENDRRCDVGDDEVTIDQDRLQLGYIALNGVIPWFVSKSADMEHGEYVRMLKKLRQGANSARGDDTSNPVRTTHGLENRSPQRIWREDTTYIIGP